MFLSIVGNHTDHFVNIQHIAVINRDLDSDLNKTLSGFGDRRMIPPSINASNQRKL